MLSLFLTGFIVTGGGSLSLGFGLTDDPLLLDVDVGGGFAGGSSGIMKQKELNTPSAGWCVGGGLLTCAAPCWGRGGC